MKQKARVAAAPMAPGLDVEMVVVRQMGLTRIAGVDEAGRGALAGPVVAAAVILPFEERELLAALAGVRDSKQLSAATREALYEVVVANALCYAVAGTAAPEIDRIGIMAANFRAMRAAVSQLEPAADFLLVDGLLAVRHCRLPQQAIVRGDGRCLSIAAASILAKVTRDRQMATLDREYPQYGFGRHKGYGTARHLAALERYGPCPAHRHSFAPIRQAAIGTPRRNRPRQRPARDASCDEP